MRISTYESLVNESGVVYVKKTSSQNFPNVNEILSPDDIYKISVGAFNMDKKTEEHVLLFSLNTRHKIIGVFECGAGTIDSSIVDIRGIFMKLFALNAQSFAVVHNHPSGDEKPSEEDIKITKRLCTVGKYLNLPMLDHVIVANGCEFYSMYENRKDLFE